MMYKRIENIERTTKEINATVAKLNLSHKSPHKSQTDLKSLEEKEAKLLMTVQTLSQQLDKLRRWQHKAIKNIITLQIVSQEINDNFKDIIECKRTGGKFIQKKREAWKAISIKYNSSCTSGPRDADQLKTLYDNMKQKSRKDVGESNMSENRASLFCSGLLRKEPQQFERTCSDGSTHVSVYNELSWRLLLNDPTNNTYQKNIWVGHTNAHTVRI
ncbi:hypothetical protein SFRURICE_003500 [Spodoptera frugiperda]|nr:hypothetical protein SFRURICE_003500 [Spodoptera frugiperda]